VTLDVTRDDIAAAAGRIEGHVRRTPLFGVTPVDGEYQLSLKLESLQRTGSFKVRGAFSLLTSSDSPEAGVVAASGGNFGLAVACAAMDLGILATVFVPNTSPAEKVDQLERYQARVEVVPGYYPDALEAATAWSQETGALQAHAYDQHAVVAGQGTCAIEVTDDLPGVDTLLVAVGGGGLIGGIASWVQDRTRVVGIESESCPTLFEARRQGGPVDIEVGGIAASAMGAGRLGAHCWQANLWIDDSLLVRDEALSQAQNWLWETCRIVAEPAGAAPIAALLGGAYRPDPEEQVVAIISGGNTAPGLVA
jgi:threonine dehydratase